MLLSESHTSAYRSSGMSCLVYDATVDLERPHPTVLRKSERIASYSSQCFLADILRDDISGPPVGAAEEGLVNALGDPLFDLPTSGVYQVDKGKDAQRASGAKDWGTFQGTQDMQQGLKKG